MRILSYEIFFDKELAKLKNKTDLKHKSQSKKACREIQFAIVQDEVRKSILAEEYNILPERNIKNNPNLYAFTKSLVNEGFNVIIFSLYRPGIYQGELFDGARFEYYGTDRSENLKTKLRLLKQNFVHIIGIDQGIIEAARMAKVS